MTFRIYYPVFKEPKSSPNNLIIILCPEIDGVQGEVLGKMLLEDGVYTCTVCGYNARDKTRVYDHVEARHVESGGYSCPFCDKVCPSYSAFKMHKSRYHKATK